MDIWFFVILVLAIALVFGPISMLRPSPAQRRKEALRLHAANNNVRFGFRTPPKLKTALTEPVPMPVYYLAPPTQQQPMPEWMLIRTDYEHEGNFYKDWDWQDHHRPSSSICERLRHHLPAMPKSVSVISQGEAGTCVYWNEQEGIDLLDQLIEMLRELHPASPASPASPAGDADPS